MKNGAAQTDGDHLAGTSTPWAWKADLAMSRPIVVIVSSHST
jgi:hypothetical protein